MGGGGGLSPMAMERIRGYYQGDDPSEIEYWRKTLRLAEGGMASGMFMAGDQKPGQTGPNEEIIIPPPGITMVIPVDDLKGGKKNMPKMAKGGMVNNPWGRKRGPLPFPPSPIKSPGSARQEWRTTGLPIPSAPIKSPGSARQEWSTTGLPIDSNPSVGGDQEWRGPQLRTVGPPVGANPPVGGDMEWRGPQLRTVAPPVGANLPGGGDMEWRGPQLRTVGPPIDWPVRDPGFMGGPYNRPPSPIKPPGGVNPEWRTTGLPILPAPIKPPGGVNPEWRTALPVVPRGPGGVNPEWRTALKGGKKDMPKMAKGGMVNNPWGRKRGPLPFPPSPMPPFPKPPGGVNPEWRTVAPPIAPPIGANPPSGGDQEWRGPEWRTMNTAFQGGPRTAGDVSPEWSTALLGGPRAPGGGGWFPTAPSVWTGNYAFGHGDTGEIPPPVSDAPASEIGNIPPPANSQPPPIETMPLPYTPITPPPAANWQQSWQQLQAQYPQVEQYGRELALQRAQRVPEREISNQAGQVYGSPSMQGYNDAADAIVRRAVNMREYGTETPTPGMQPIRRMSGGGTFRVPGFNTRTYTPEEFANMPAVRQLTGDLPTPEFQGLGKPLMFGGRELPSLLNLQSWRDMDPTTQQIIAGIYETPEDMGGLGMSFADILKRSANATPFGKTFGPASYRGR